MTEPTHDLERLDLDRLEHDVVLPVHPEDEAGPEILPGHVRRELEARDDG